MDINEAVAYLTPHKMTNDSGAIMLTAGKVREAACVMSDRIAALEALALELAGKMVEARDNLAEIKGHHSRWYDGKADDYPAIRDMERCAYSAVIHIDAALSSPLLAELREKGCGNAYRD